MNPGQRPIDMAVDDTSAASTTAGQRRTDNIGIGKGCVGCAASGRSEYTTAVSVLDRLVHHANVVITDGESHGMREARISDLRDVTRLRTSSRLRKQVHEWEQMREHERNLRKYLGDDVLTTAGSALVWWLARHFDDDEAVPAAVRLIDELSTLSMVSQDHGGLSQTGLPPPTAVGLNGDGGIDLHLAVATRELLERLFPHSGDERMLFAASRVDSGAKWSRRVRGAHSYVARGAGPQPRSARVRW